MQKPNLGELIFFFVLLGAVALLAIAVMWPYVVPIFLATVFTVLCAPLHRHFLRLTGDRRTFAATATVLIVLFALLVPLILVGVLLFQEVADLYTQLANGQGIALVTKASDFIEAQGQRLVPGFEFQLNILSYAQDALRWVGQNLNAFFSGILSFLFDVFLIIVTMFFLYRDGDRLREFAVKWSPLPDRYDESILAKLELAIASVVKGSLTTAAVQGILVGAGFTVFDVPNPILWGVVASVAALIPLLGTALITMPAAVALFLMGHAGAGLGLALYALVVVGLSDNVLNPLLMRRGIDIHPFLILLSVFGGLAYFGPVGFIAGPVILAFFFTLLDIYPSIMKGRPIENGTTGTV